MFEQHKIDKAKTTMAKEHNHSTCMQQNTDTHLAMVTEWTQVNPVY